MHILYIPAYIHTIEELFICCSDVFSRDGFPITVLNLDILEETIQYGSYSIEFEDISGFLFHFGPHLTQEYFGERYDVSDMTIAESILDMTSFFPHDGIHREVGHLSGYHTRVWSTYFYELHTQDNLQELTYLYQRANTLHIPWLYIGGGTNILFSQSYFPGIVVQNKISNWEYDENKKILYATSGAAIWEIAEQLEKQYNQSLWHRFIGLPGSIGGAVYGNAGCFGLETASNFVSCEVYDMLSGLKQTFTKDEMQFSYRYSFLKEHPHFFLVSATFDLSEKKEKYTSTEDNIKFRNEKQPKGYCCGSFFKNPSREHSAGSLIESVGLKGYHYGGAYWSDLHANFLMSEGESTSPEDLIALVQFTQEKVKDATGYELLPEVKII